MFKIYCLLLCLLFLPAAPGFSQPDSLPGKTYPFYSLSDTLIDHYPFKNQNNINRFFPGVVSYFQDFYIRGGRSNETGFFVEGVKFNDLFTGENSFFINPGALSEIEYYPGFIPADMGNASSGIFNYKLKTGGEKLEFNAEHINDNISFTNDPFSGDRRLGAYYYGYNETNLNLGGLLFSKNTRFFINADYLFQRDKNPQRYPGIDNLLFRDRNSGDSIRISLPEGIVPLNSFESFNILSTMLFDFEEIKVKVSGIYFTDNEYTERDHILNYLNPRQGLIEKKGGIFSINYDHNVNDLLSYSLNFNYYRKNVRINDPILGANYWGYGDSLVNGQNGIAWTSEGGGYYGRYGLPRYLGIYGNYFEASYYPSVNHEKSEQSRFTFTGKVSFSLNNLRIGIGGEAQLQQVRYWGLQDQYMLAEIFAVETPAATGVSNQEELKKYILTARGVNNYGYDPMGIETESGIYASPKPKIYSSFIDAGLNINSQLHLYAGLRFDHFNYDYKRMKDPSLPESAFARYNLVINENGLTNGKTFSILSQKIYMSYSILKNLSFSIGYSKNVQSHYSASLYEGFHHMPRAMDLFSHEIVNVSDLEPVISDVYEAGVDYRFFDNLGFRLNYYRKEIKNQLSTDTMITNRFQSNFTNYIIREDNGESTANGVELLVDYSGRSILLLSSLTYQKAEGNDDKLSSAGERLRGVEDRTTLELLHNNKFNFKFLISYNFAELQEKSRIFDDLNLSLQYSFNSGHPFARLILNSDYAVYATEITPDFSQFDLKLEKGFSVIGIMNFNLYLYVVNMFDTKNVFNVFAGSGSAEDDGYFDDPDVREQFVQVYGEGVVELYRLQNLYNPNGGQQVFFGPPRQIGLGIKLCI